MDDLTKAIIVSLFILFLIILFLGFIKDKLTEDNTPIQVNNTSTNNYTNTDQIKKTCIDGYEYIIFNNTDIEQVFVLQKGMKNIFVPKLCK